MSMIQRIALSLLCLFYAVYLIKMMLLRRHGISGNLLGKGDKPAKARVIELLLRAATGTGAVVQFASVLFPRHLPALPAGPPLSIMGLIIMALGCTFFLPAITVMKNNWRAGFSSNQNTSLVTWGIYRFSRNPAFVGFDLIYIGCVLACPNWINILTSVLAVVLFHVQIIGEERYLAGAFGEEYLRYRTKVRRYL